MNHRGKLELKLDDSERWAEWMPNLKAGFRSFLYRFDTPGGEMNFGGQVGEVLQHRSATEVIVGVDFWADAAAGVVVNGATFDVWMGEVIGSGRVLEAQAANGGATLVTYELAEVERQLLRAGINEWGGPSRCTHDMAIAMGFANVEDVFEQGARISERLRHGEPMSSGDWSRAMLALEVCFASSIGSTLDWSITTGFSDEETIRLIRGLQRKIRV